MSQVLQPVIRSNLFSLFFYPRAATAAMAAMSAGCLHPEVWSGLCVICGASLDAAAVGASNMLNVVGWGQNARGFRISEEVRAQDGVDYVF